MGVLLATILQRRADWSNGRMLSCSPVFVTFIVGLLSYCGHRRDPHYSLREPDTPEPDGTGTDIDRFHATGIFRRHGALVHTHLLPTRRRKAGSDGSSPCFSIIFANQSEPG